MHSRNGNPANWEFAVSNIGSTWNDRISSFQGYSNCQPRLFENANYTGANYGPYDHSANVGAAMNDRTTSIIFY